MTFHRPAIIIVTGHRTLGIRHQHGRPMAGFGAAILSNIYQGFALRMEPSTLRIRQKLPPSSRPARTKQHPPSFPTSPPIMGFARSATASNVSKERVDSSYGEDHLPTPAIPGGPAIECPPAIRPTNAMALSLECRPMISSLALQSAGRPTLGGSSASSGSTHSSFLNSGLPSAERTYPILALLELLRFRRQLDVMKDLDVLADDTSLAQVLRYQRAVSEGGDVGLRISHYSSSSSSISSGKSGKSSKSSKGRSKATGSPKQSSYNKELRLHALLHGNTLVLLSDLYEALGHLEDIPETMDSRLRAAVEDLTHNPLLGSIDHKRAVQYNAGSLNYLVLFTARASDAKYEQQPFIPISHSAREFPGAKIDYHVIPDGVTLPLEHELLVHCCFDGPDERQFAVDEMTFNRIDRLMEIKEGSKVKESKNLGVRKVDTDLGKAADLVEPFLRQLKAEMMAKKSPMVMLQQLDNGEILIVEDKEPLVALADALKDYARF
ncbi:13812_t:CDS:2 [Acaulospora colombiana]|uniref:13812_t:CDS:1 n=1 Tax=Acaulospora colombiana TaxID=27376 RepID=A0ACA9MLQ5_9GLOM|nr:13812_t:CDS:2 [Acaulospora colombiana]